MTGAGLASRAGRRRRADRAQPRGAAGDGAAHRATADRLRRGLDDLSGLDAACSCASWPRLAASSGPTVLVESLQEGGAFRQTTLNGGQVDDERSLLALQVNGADLSLDHGFPARVIVPALPGVHNTKWVQKMTFQAA